MAEIDLTVNQPTSSGITPTVQTGVTAAATDQYFMPASRDMVLRVSNGAGAVDMTIVTGAMADGLAIADRVVNIPTNGTRVFGNFDPAVYGASGRIQFTFAAADANIVMEAYRVPQFP